MTRIVFSDVDEFSDTLAGTAGRCMPTARSTEEWWVQTLASGGVRMQTFQIGGRSTFAGDGKLNQITLQVPLSDPARSRLDGWPLDLASCLLVGNGQPFVLTTLAATRWVSLVIPSDHDLLVPEHMKSKMSLLFDNKPGSRAIVSTQHLDRIRLLAHRLTTVADGAALDAAANAAQEEIVATVSQAIAASSRPPSRKLGRPSFARARIIGKILALTETSPGAPLLTDDLCRRTGVSERTLRNVFHEYFAVGPVRFLKVRQLRNIRQALLAADPARETVTRIAMRFGISDLSLFAYNYKSLFGESPSYTLRTVSGRPQRPVMLRDPWLQYATCDSSRLTGDVLPQPARHEPSIC
jgi:AraC family ethanolamine operon transcriptional activator